MNDRVIIFNFQVKLLPKQGTLLPRRGRPASQPFETTFRLQVRKRPVRTTFKLGPFQWMKRISGGTRPRESAKRTRESGQFLRVRRRRAAASVVGFIAEFADSGTETTGCRLAGRKNKQKPLTQPHWLTPLFLFSPYDSKKFFVSFFSSKSKLARSDSLFSKQRRAPIGFFQPVS